MGARVLRPGERFRGLLVHGALGRGAMGVAHLASHSVLRMPLVVKTFGTHEGDPLSEAHLAARVRSAHVVDVLDAGWEDEQPFVVQEYVDGIDLAELCERIALLDRRLPVALVARIVRDVARGLHAIHRAGVVHRDLKPANTFLSGDGHAMVGDFGIAVDPAKSARAESRVAGTPHFLAPEVWRGAPPAPASDLYALGATAHLVATGEPPFAASTIEQLIFRQIEEEYVPPPTLDPAEAYLFAIVRQLLAKEPADRPSSADRVARELSRLDLELPTWIARSEREARVGELELRVRAGDIAEAESDVIVCAANWQLKMEVGVAAALSRAGGPTLEAEARASAPAAMGDVVWTSAGALKARWVAHAIAAMSGAICIQRCTLRALLEARARGATSVSFPALGTGVGDVPHALAAKLTLDAVETFAQIGAGSVRRVEVVLFDEHALDAWIAALGAL